MNEYIIYMVLKDKYGPIKKKLHTTGDILSASPSYPEIFCLGAYFTYVTLSGGIISRYHRYHHVFGDKAKTGEVQLASNSNIN